MYCVGFLVNKHPLCHKLQMRYYRNTVFKLIPHYHIGDRRSGYANLYELICNEGCDVMAILDDDEIVHPTCLMKAFRLAEKKRRPIVFKVLDMINIEIVDLKPYGPVVAPVDIYKLPRKGLCPIHDHHIPEWYIQLDCLCIHFGEIIEETFNH